MRPLSYMLSVVDRNVVLRRMPVYLHTFRLCPWASLKVYIFILHVVVGSIMKYFDPKTATALGNNVGALGMILKPPLHLETTLALWGWPWNRHCTWKLRWPFGNDPETATALGNNVGALAMTLKPPLHLETTLVLWEWPWYRHCTWKQRWRFGNDPETATALGNNVGALGMALTTLALWECLRRDLSINYYIT